MTRLKIAGVLWIAVAAFALAITLTFRVDMTQTVVTIALTGVAIAVGGWLLLRPNDAAMRMASVTGAVWFAVYAALMIIQSDDPAAWVTNAGLAVAGAALALLAWKSRTAQTIGSYRGDR